MEVLTFRISDQHFALPITDVSEVLPLPALIEPAAGPSTLAGFLNWRAAAIPVIRLDRIFGIPRWNPTVRSHLIVLSSGLALISEAAAGIHSIEKGDIVAINPAHSLNGCVKGKATLGGDDTLFLSTDALLLEQERRAIQDLRCLAQSRLAECERTTR